MQELLQSIGDTEQQLNKLKKLKELLEQLEPDSSILAYDALANGVPTLTYSVVAYGGDPAWASVMYVSTSKEKAEGQCAMMVRERVESVGYCVSVCELASD